MDFLSTEVTFQETPISEDLGPVLDNDEVLFGELVRSVTAPAPPPTTRLVRGLNYSHEAMIDAIVANPGIRQNDLASMFGYSVSWISQIVGSDTFQAKLAARSHEFRDPVLLASVDEQFRGILLRGLELTRKKLESDEINDNFLLRSMEMSSRALGYGAKKDDSRKSNVEETLANLSSNLVGLLKQKRQAVVVEGEIG